MNSRGRIVRPLNFDCRHRLAQIIAACGFLFFVLSDCLAQPTARDFITQGNRKYDKHDYPGAAADYTEALKLDARNATAFYDRGLARQAVKDWDGATADFTQAIEINPKNAAAYLQRAEIKEFRDDLDGAIADFDQAIKIAPRYAPAYLARAGARQSKHDWDGALADCNRAIELDAKKIRAYFERGFLKQNKNDLSGAIEDYNRILTYDKTNTAVFFNLASIKREQGDMDGALKDYAQIIQINPTNAHPHYLRGDILLRTGDLNGAIDEFGRAIELARANSGSPDMTAYLGRSFALQEKGDTNAAIETLNEFIKFSPTSSWEFSTRARFKQLNGDLSGAMADYDTAIKLATTNELSFLYPDRGSVRLAAGDSEGALSDFNRCLDLMHEDKFGIPAYVWLAQTQKGNKKAADEALAKYLGKKVDKPRVAWWETLERYFLDRATEAELTKAAESGDIHKRRYQRGFLWYFTGMKQLVAGDKADAIARFKRCVAVAPLESYEYFLAKIELARLAK